jgi:DNA-binding XRE family transcriptional regulator
MTKYFTYTVKPQQFIIARTLLKRNQSYIASEIGVSLNSYSKIERNESDFKYSTYTKIVDFFVKNKIIFYPNGNVNLDN